MTVLIAHRGYSWVYPENSMSAFTSALQLSMVDGIEMDVARSADGIYFALHDDTLDRTMIEDGLDQSIINAVSGIDVWNLNWDLISQVPIGIEDEPCPLIYDTIAAAKEHNKMAVVEFKTMYLANDMERMDYISGFKDAMKDLFTPSANWDPTKKVVFISFDELLLPHLKTYFPDHERLFLLSFMGDDCSTCTPVGIANQVQQSDATGLQTDPSAHVDHPTLKDELDARGLTNGIWVAGLGDGQPGRMFDRSPDEHQYVIDRGFDVFTSDIPDFVVTTNVWKDSATSTAAAAGAFILTYFML